MITQLSGQTLLVFAGIPVLAIAVVALLVYAPSIATGPRYRPGLSWWAPPVWINGPSQATDHATDPATDRATDLATGQSTDPAATDAPQLGPGQTTATSGAGVARTTGGASASW